MPTTVEGITLKPMSLGASIVLFQFVADSPEALVNARRDCFQTAKLLKHGTLLVDAHPVESFEQLTEQWATAKNR